MEKLKLIKCCKTLLLLIGISLFAGKIYAQNNTLRGRVIDQRGEALIGATVKTTGAQSQGVTTDVAGNFVLPAAANTTSISVSYIGFVTLNVPVKSGTTNLGNIVLTADANSLDEVVVVGYGTLKRQDVTGTVVTVDAKSLQEIPASNVFVQLQGKVAGLDVTYNNNGTPSLLIRGNRTISNPGADGPLIVLDGSPYGQDINTINPNDIKTVDILKGASATAIYGSRGAGGVLLITTNRGRVGQVVTRYDAQYGINTLAGKLRMLNGQEYNQLKFDGIEGGYLQTGTGSQSPQATYPLTDLEKQALAEGVNTDYVDLLIKNAYTLDQNLTVQGGTERTTFNVGLGYRTNTELESSDLWTKRIRLNTSIDHKINNYVKFGINIDQNLTMSNGGFGGGLGTAQWLSPLSYPYNPDGSVNPTPVIGTLDGSTRSPLLARTMQNAFYDYNRANVGNYILYGQVDPVKHLNYRYLVNYQTGQSVRNQYTGMNGVDVLTNDRTSAATTHNSSYRLYQQHTVTYDNTFWKDHRVNFVAVFETTKNHSENNNVSATGIPSDANKNANLGLGTFNNMGGGWSENGLISYIGRLNYVFMNKYDLTATMRYDGNSTLAVGRQWITYPSIGLGWVISDEAFMRSQNVVNFLKLRAGWGITSTTAGSGAYGTLGQLDPSQFQYGGGSGGNAQGVRVTRLVNNNLTWQQTAEYNLALDFSLFKSRITGSIEVYNQKTTGIILNNNLPQTLGANTQPTNLGESTNRGLEITLSSQNIQNKGGFSWSTDFNIAFNRERIDALPNGGLINIGNGQFVGQPMSVIYDVRKIGIWQLSDATQTNKLDGSGNPIINPTTGQPYLTSTAVNGQTSPLQYPGQVRIQDLNADGKIDANDNQFIGHFNPNYVFGLTNRFTYKNFDLSILIQARMGFTTVVPYVASANSGTAGWQYLNLGRHNQPYIPYWTPRNQDAQFPMPNGLAQSPFQSSLQYFDGSFIRAKSINLGYNIPANILKAIGISQLRVYANVTNPFFIYAPVRNHGFYVPDAESVSGIGGQIVGPSQNGNIAGAGTAYGITAGTQQRTFLFGINARF
jgi:TonB-linked SusC/RagA family outer membrane protein